MPALVLFDQRTMFAGDDLRCCTKLHAIWRVMQLALACGIIIVHFSELKTNSSLIDDLIECEDSGEANSLARIGRILLHIYEFGSIFLCIASLGLSGSMYKVSGRGTPTDATLRRSLVPLCYIDMIGTNVLRLALLVIGILCIYAVEIYCQCLSSNPALSGLQDIRRECNFLSPFITMLFVLVGTHIVDAICAVLTLVYFTCGCALPVKTVSSAQRCAVLLRCCFGCTSVLTCCLFGGTEVVLGDFAEFSVLIADYLNNNGILDLTASDVLMGLDMVRRLRRQHTLEARGRIIKESTTIDVEPVAESNAIGDINIEAVEVPRPKTLDEKESSLISPHDGISSLSNPPKREVLSIRDRKEVYSMAEAAHFVVYAQAAYTWVSFILEHPITGFCRLSYQLLSQCRCCYHSSEKGRIKGDFLWRPHTVALQLISGLTMDDIVYATFHDTIDAIPYFIAVDHEWKTVVLAIRGTLTLESVFADIAILPTELTEMGRRCGFNGEGLYCHKGMLQSATWLYEDLSRHGNLDLALQQYSNYRLRIVGHSLGAAVGSILSVFLRSKYTNLRCLAFSPPGCTMSENLAEATAEYTNSFTIDDDIIARMSIEGFEELRDSVLEMVYRVKIPKYLVSQQIKKIDFSSLDEITEYIDSTLYNEETIRSSRFKEQVEDFWKFQGELKKRTDQVKLCPPGSIIHLVGTGRNQRSSRKKGMSLDSLTTLDDNMLNSDRRDSDRRGPTARRYIPRWANRKDFEKLAISSHMLLDHEPIGVKVKIQTVAEERFGLNAPFLCSEPCYDET